MWAIPVLLSSLIFWPIWLVLLISLLATPFVRAVRRDDSGNPSTHRVNPVKIIRSLPRRYGEALVGCIERHKYNMLALSVVLAIGLGAWTCFVFLIEHRGGHLSKSVEEYGGYVAIAGLVFGLPALGYAMVTDTAVQRIENLIGADKKVVRNIKHTVEESLEGFRKYLGDDHFVQVFVPDKYKEKLFPIYDPDDKGPREGWGIDKATPQAITGSAWVAGEYLCGLGQDELMKSKLRLTAEQVKRFEDLNAVAAAPIVDPERKRTSSNGDEESGVIGVLTVCSTATESKIKTDQNFRKKHETAAERLVPDLKGHVAEEGPLSQRELSEHG